MPSTGIAPCPVFVYNGFSIIKMYLQAVNNAPTKFRLKFGDFLTACMRWISVMHRPCPVIHCMCDLQSSNILRNLHAIGIPDVFQQPYMLRHKPSLLQIIDTVASRLREQENQARSLAQWPTRVSHVFPLGPHAFFEAMAHIMTVGSGDKTNTLSSIYIFIEAAISLGSKTVRPALSSSAPLLRSIMAVTQENLENHESYNSMGLRSSSVDGDLPSSALLTIEVFSNILLYTLPLSTDPYPSLLGPLGLSESRHANVDRLCRDSLHLLLRLKRSPREPLFVDIKPLLGLLLYFSPTHLFPETICGSIPPRFFSKLARAKLSAHMRDEELYMLALPILLECDTNPKCDSNVCRSTNVEKVLYRCSSCRTTTYCDDICQKSAWKSHKSECKHIISLTNQGQLTGLIKIYKSDWKSASEIFRERCSTTGVKAEDLRAFLGVHDQLMVR